MSIATQAAPSSEEALLLIERLLAFARQQELLHELDVPYGRNALLDLFGFAEPYGGVVPAETTDNVSELLEPLLDYGCSIGLVPAYTTTQRDLLDARIMGLLMPRPSEAAASFRERAEREGLSSATDAFYRMNIASNYIRMDRIASNLYWQHETSYGNLEMTINLSKPEKDPQEIAKLRSMPQGHYPRCLLCADNVGYAGRIDHPARQNLRVLPLQLGGEDWCFQYSPYVYYNEHSIVLKAAHEPMSISPDTFVRLLDFVEQFPHYFIGSNADLPIVGGSILSHDHFQAGRHVFPMETAKVEAYFTDDGNPGVSIGIVEWPMSVIRLNGASRSAVLEAANRILDAWRGYSDASAEVLAWTEREGGIRESHNTVTPIARLRDNGEYELDLVLRNNRTSSEHPDGIFHPHRSLHHIKKENIGLIEVMGLAVLPGRLSEELKSLSLYLTPDAIESIDKLGQADHPLHKHGEWLASLAENHGTANSNAQAWAIMQHETGERFLDVLTDAGVFKRTERGREAFHQFLASAGASPK
ncbi:UDP-glucose--hexose-1-phosphate uridylyltransferase [Paenibacillus sp. 1011MAR3C5]|uniref:UDP-glucose--hexose-1-phosphate uridylyltransferase n=1 Tax=Paenibacillus sp. 1011MAR3C5 TaxID=1675787 RepID=UPI000E6BFA18|nr:UDP-glucose--hexose-1-phosphate uridylyltransferase [Paenibacillus sp. 1011MAR3C5]RJE87652.1 UDP-glucose--hexose-1-phosphate uridylyltransferase [Paenibacillus sp. 1011MAR3C5]